MPSPGLGPPTSEEVLNTFLKEEREDLFRALASSNGTHEDLLTLRGQAKAIKSMEKRVEALKKKS
jgi:hypothetical protein